MRILLPDDPSSCQVKQQQQQPNQTNGNKKKTLQTKQNSVCHSFVFLCTCSSFIHAYTVSWSHPPSNSPPRTSLSQTQSLVFYFIMCWAQLVPPLCMEMWGPSGWPHKPVHMGNTNWTQCFTNSLPRAWTAYIWMTPHPFTILYGKNF